MSERFIAMSSAFGRAKLSSAARAVWWSGSIEIPVCVTVLSRGARPVEPARYPAGAAAGGMPVTGFRRTRRTGMFQCPPTIGGTHASEIQA